MSVCMVIHISYVRVWYMYASMLKTYTTHVRVVYANARNEIRVAYLLTPGCVLTFY